MNLYNTGALAGCVLTTVRQNSIVTKVNKQITAPFVRVIGDDGEQLGVLPLVSALELARSKGVDLVEIAATANPPVCRLVDLGKYKFDQNKLKGSARDSKPSTQTSNSNGDE